MSTTTAVTTTPQGRLQALATLAEDRRGKRAPNAGRKFPAEPLTPEEMVRLLDALGNGSSGIRDAALVVVLWRSGLRIAEALALRPHHINLDVGSITVLHGKGDRRRVVGIDPVACRYIGRWLARREELGVPLTAQLFCTITRDAGGVGRPLHAMTFRESLRRAARRAQIPKRVHPHGLRHTHAFELATEGVGMHVIRAQLGHSNLAMTQHYIDHLAPVAVIDAMRERNWPAEMLAVTLAQSATSQGETLPAPTLPLSPLPPASDVVPEPTRASHDFPGRINRHNPAMLQPVLDVLAGNGGRSTEPQLSRALGISRSRVSGMLRELHARELVIKAGLGHSGEGRGPRAQIWRLAPPKATYTLDEPRDPRLHRQPAAKAGSGPGRVRDAIEALGGRASQAQLARDLGLDVRTIGQHCRALESDGRLTRGGLDKSTSNRGSQVWRLSEPKTVRTTGTTSAWRTMTISIPANRPSRTA